MDSLKTELAKDLFVNPEIIVHVQAVRNKGNLKAYAKIEYDGIFEIRCKVGNNISRVLYFFYYERKIILTNGFIKKTQGTPLEEIKLAKERRDEFKERMGNL